MTPRAFSRATITSLVAGLLLVAAAESEDVAPPTASSTDAASANTPAAKAPRCTVRKDDIGWSFVSPSGEPFFSLGICMFNQGLEKKDYLPEKPGYAAWRHYDSPEAWAGASLVRAKQWGFTTVGGWSDYETLAQSSEHDLWITPVLHLGSRSGAPWFDMWDEKVLHQIDDVAKATIPNFRGGRRVIGYYSDNELGWWNAIHWKMTLEQPATSGQRQRLIQLVREVYNDDWNALVQDFEPQNATDWKSFDSRGMLWLRPGGNGIRTMRRFLGLAAERYYEIMRGAIRKHDPDAMYLGDRYQSFYYPEVPLAARRDVDVISTNLNVSWNDGTFLRSFLDTLHSLSGKPVIASEFYMAAVENRSGNKNLVGGFPAVPTQKERGEALANTLRELGRLHYVVGADWFQYYDEPPHGRKLDGEDYNFGLVDIHDEPYSEVVETFSSIDLAELKSTVAPRRPDATHGVPPAPADPLSDFRYMGALKNWDRQRGYVPPATPHPPGDLYLCWSPTALYLGAYVLDIVEPDYYRDGEIPETDRAKWTIRVNGAKPLSARIGAGKEPVLNRPGPVIKSLSGTYHDVRCITVVELPPAHFGKRALKPGDQIALDSTYSTHARANRIEWKGTFVLSD